jgi:cell division transport system permease protein
MQSHRFRRRHIQAMKQSLKRLWCTPWTTGVTVIVIAVTLVLPLLFWFLIGQFKPLANAWRQGKEISLYLDASVSVSEGRVLLKRVRAVEGVGSAEFISADMSLTELEQQEGMQDIRQYLPENPLPSMIEVMPTRAMDTPEKMEHLFQTLKHESHVEQAKLNREWVSRLHVMLGFLTHLTWLLGALFGLMVVFIIRNLLRLSAQEHHEEIQVLKLIGATDAFILRPFLYTGVCLGGLGALGAFLGAHMVLLGLEHVLQGLFSPGFGLPRGLGFSVVGTVWCVLLGMTLGWVGAYLPLKHQLARVEPCY